MDFFYINCTFFLIHNVSFALLFWLERLWVQFIEVLSFIIFSYFLFDEDGVTSECGELWKLYMPVVYNKNHMPYFPYKLCLALFISSINWVADRYCILPSKLNSSCVECIWMSSNMNLSLLFISLGTLLCIMLGDLGINQLIKSFSIHPLCCWLLTMMIVLSLYTQWSYWQWVFYLLKLPQSCVSIYYFYLLFSGWGFFMCICFHDFLLCESFLAWPPYSWLIISLWSGLPKPIKIYTHLVFKF